MIRLLVVEDHALVREGLVRLLRQLEDEVVIREASHGEEAMAALEDDDDVDLVMLDLAMPGMDGFACLNELRERYPAIPVAVVSAYDDQPSVTRVLNHGASGFIPKAYSGEALLSAVREILDGNLFRPSVAQTPATIDDALPEAPGDSTITPAEIGLTDRQAQVLALMVRGLPNREIARQLDLSEGTVKVHATAIFKALGVSSRTQALLTVSRYRIDFDKVF